MTRARPALPPPPVIAEVVDSSLSYAPIAPGPAQFTRSRAARLSRLRGFVPTSLTARLVTGVVALVFILVTVVGCATYYSLKPFLQDRLNQQVSALANNRQAVYTYVASGGSSAAMGGPLDVWAGIITDDGTRAYDLPQTSASLHSMKLSSRDAEGFATHSGPRTITTVDGVELVAQTAPGVTTNVLGSIVIVGLSTAGVHDTLHRLIVLELLLGISAVLFAALLTSWGVRAGLRPLVRVSRTAQEVTAELGPDGAGLERRVPGPEDDTEVGQVASSMNRLLEAVQTEFTARVTSEERMRQFLADASHELRTPLTSIRGYAELSRLTGGGGVDPDDPMRRIEIEGTRMSRLVEDLLVLARGDQDALTEHEPVEIDRVLADAADMSHSAYPEREINTIPSHGAVVIGDHDQLVRLLVNLLNNAAVHTAPGGPIRLEATMVPTAMPPAVLLRVIDAGPGLPPDQAAHVFERFWRADKARSRVKGGSGLGMAIVAQIVETHGGIVRFDSAVDTGTTVTVTLPTAVNRPTGANPVREIDPARQN